MSKRSREEGGSTQGLTVSAEVASACSGKHWSERGGERDLRRWEVEDDDVEALGGVRRCTARRGGRGILGGALGHLRASPGWRCPRWWRAAATEAFGREEQRRGRAFGGERGRAGRLWGSRGIVQTRRGGARQAGREEVAAACSCARRARALAYWREEEGDRRAPGGLGRQLGRPGGFGGCQVGIFSLCFLFF